MYLYSWLLVFSASKQIYLFEFGNLHDVMMDINDINVYNIHIRVNLLENVL